MDDRESNEAAQPHEPAESAPRAGGRGVMIAVVLAVIVGLGFLLRSRWGTAPVIPAPRGSIQVSVESVTRDADGSCTIRVRVWHPQAETWSRLDVKPSLFIAKRPQTGAWKVSATEPALQGLVRTPRIFTFRTEPVPAEVKEAILNAMVFAEWTESTPGVSFMQRVELDVELPPPAKPK